MSSSSTENNPALQRWDDAFNQPIESPRGERKVPHPIALPAKSGEFCPFTGKIRLNRWKIATSDGSFIADLSPTAVVFLKSNSVFCRSNTVFAKNSTALWEDTTGFYPGNTGFCSSSTVAKDYTTGFGRSSVAGAPGITVGSGATLLF